jgi:hypothetical protein
VLTLTRKQLECQPDEDGVPERNPGFFLDYTVVTPAPDGEVEDQNARQERKKQIAKVGSMWNLSQRFRHFPEHVRLVILAVAVTVVAAWVPNTAAADSERGSAVDQYLEQVPSAEGNKSSDDNKSAGGNASGTQGGSTPSTSGSNGSANGGSGDANAKSDAKKKHKAEKQRKQQAKDDATQDKAAKEGDSQDKQNVTPVPASSSSDGGDGDGGGAPVGLVLVLVVLSLIASAAFVLRRRAGGGRTTSARGSQQPS